MTKKFQQLTERFAEVRDIDISDRASVERARRLLSDMVKARFDSRSGLTADEMSELYEDYESYLGQQIARADDLAALQHGPQAPVVYDPADEL